MEVLTQAGDGSAGRTRLIGSHCAGPWQSGRQRGELHRRPHTCRRPPSCWLTHSPLTPPSIKGFISSTKSTILFSWPSSIHIIITILVHKFFMLPINKMHIPFISKIWWASTSCIHIEKICSYESIIAWLSCGFTIIKHFQRCKIEH